MFRVCSLYYYFSTLQSVCETQNIFWLSSVVDRIPGPLIIHGEPRAPVDLRALVFSFTKYVCYPLVCHHHDQAGILWDQAGIMELFQLPWSFENASYARMHVDGSRGFPAKKKVGA